MKFLVLTFTILLSQMTFAKNTKEPGQKITRTPTAGFEVNPTYIKIKDVPGKGTYFLDPITCDFKIIRQNLQISLKRDPDTSKESFLIEFPNGRTIVGHIQDERNTNLQACFHSLSAETKSGYMLQVNNHSKEHVSGAKVLQGMDECLKTVRDPKIVRVGPVTEEITYLPNSEWCRNPSDCWANKSIVRIRQGAGLIFHQGYGAQVGSTITRMDLKFDENLRDKCSNTESTNGQSPSTAKPKAPRPPK